MSAISSMCRALAEVGLDDIRIGPDFLGGAVGDFHAVIQDHQFVADAHDEFHVVLDEDHRHAPRQDGVDEVDEGLGFLGVHAGGRLVEEQELGTGGQGPGDFQPALVAVGQARGLVEGGLAQPHEIKAGHGVLDDVALLGPLGRRAQDRAEKIGLGAAMAADAHVVEHGEAGKKPDVLKRPGHAQSGHALGTRTGHVLRFSVSGEQDPALGRSVDAGHTVEHGGLAGAVWADEAEDAAPGHGKRDVAQGHEAAEALGDPLHLQDRSIHRSGRPARFQPGAQFLDERIPQGRIGHLGENPGRPKTHDTHHDQAVSQKAGFGRQAELGQHHPQHLAQGNEDHRADQGAVDVAKPPEDHHAQDQKRFPELEHVRGNEKRPPGEKRPGQRADAGRNGKGDDLVEKQVDARGRGGHRVLADGEPGPAEPGVLQPAHDDIDQQHHDHAEIVVRHLAPEGVAPAVVHAEQLGQPGHVQGDRSDARHAQGAARQPDFVGQKQHHQLGKAEGDNGEIVPDQPQGRRAEHDAEQGAVYDRQGDDDPKRQVVVDGEEPGRVGADAVKPHEPKVEQAAESGQDVKPHGQDHVDHDQHDDVQDVHVPDGKQGIGQGRCREKVFESGYRTAHGCSGRFVGGRSSRPAG